MKKLKTYFLSLFTFFFVTSIVSASEENDIYKKIDVFSEVLDKINKEFVDDVNQSDAMDAAINGVLQSLDPYSAYMSPEIFNEMQTETSGEFGGLGIEVTMESGVVKVISPIDDTPASAAGESSIGVITFITPASMLTSIPSPPNSPLVSVCIL